jgi:glyoxylase-like metal-dependent hydrolase (beta-lactamase superfamily II)
MTASTPVGQSLKTEVYNPGSEGIFAVSSVLVTGAKDAVLIDAQFSAADARKLVDLIQASGKRLSTIYVSHGDPDYYFGLEVLKTAFGDAKVLATPATIEHIKATQQEKVAAWAPQLGENAPRQIVIPEPLDDDQIDLEGNKLEILGLDGPTPDRSFVWIPSIKTVAGGISVVAGQHVWMADTQTPQSHTDWLATLARITALQPRAVIPGHFAPGAAQNMDAVRFTADYIQAYDEEAANAKNSGELIAAMKTRYPDLSAAASLELSAKVSKGEMEWH